MKKFFFTLLLFYFFFSLASAQSPKSFNYQIVLTDNANKPIKNQAVSFRAAIIREDQNGQKFSVYSEEYNGIFTSELGQLNLSIGNGQNQNGSIQNINWSDGKYYLRTDVNTGSGFVNLGEIPFQSVPYSLFAEQAKNGVNNLSYNTGNHTLTINNTNVDLTELKNDNDADPTNEIQRLELINNNELRISGGNSVILPQNGLGDNWGTQTVQTQSTLTGNGTAGSPLGVANNSLLKSKFSSSGANHNDAFIYDANTNQWEIRKPVVLNQGPGIKILSTSNGPLSFFISAEDESPSNELQTLSFNQASKVLSLSPSGGSVDLSSLGGGSSFLTNSGTNIYSSNSGNVGIGTSSPIKKLHIVGNGLRISSGFQHFDISTRSNGKIAFEANGTTGDNTMVIDDDTRSVNIGTDVVSSGFKLNVVGKAKFQSGVFFGNTEGFTDGGTNIINLNANLKPDLDNSRDLGTSTVRFNDLFLGGKITFGSVEYFQDGGDATIQTNSSFIPFSNNTRDLGKSTLRWRDVWCSRNAFNGSDIRMKRDIKPLNYGLNEVSKMKVYSYRWKEENMDDGYRALGVLAQELKEIIPELTRQGTKEEDFMSVNYIGLIPVLIKAVQEQQSEIEELKQQQSLITSLTPEEIILLKKLISEKK